MKKLEQSILKDSKAQTTESFRLNLGYVGYSLKLPQQEALSLRLDMTGSGKSGIYTDLVEKPFTPSDTRLPSDSISGPKTSA
jgi:hypothetical protein